MATRPANRPVNQPTDRPADRSQVFVNLKCANETKMLMFKSAKTCECFFCKHV